MKISSQWSVSALAIFASSCAAQNPPTSALIAAPAIAPPAIAPPAVAPLAATPPSKASRGLLLSTDFNVPAWPAAAVADASNGAKASVEREQMGTIDTYKGQPTGALGLSADFSGAKKSARVSLSSGVLPMKNSETNLGKITLGFDVWMSNLHRVRVIVQSFDSKNKLTGSRVATVLPPVAGAWYRSSLDWDKTSPLKGKFDPTAPKIALTFQLSDEDGAVARSKQVLRVDNVSIGVPALYVSASGNDQSDGKTEKTAFATIQKAIDVAVPGDVISLLSGTYNGKGSAANISKVGAPAAWITLRANPGAKAELRCDGWNVVNFSKNAAYWEVRGLTVRGKRPDLQLEDATKDGLMKQKDGKPYYGDPLYNSNGISIDTRKESEDARAHHIRIIDNDVFDNVGGGISAINCDYITIENNRVRDNCHFMRYGGSGISIFRSWNFDGNKGHKIFVIGNAANGNRTFVPWEAVGKISDGNGIIIDDNINHQGGASQIPYEGRTLVQNNLSFGNGGSGVHAYASRFVDIVNNTAYYNAQSPELKWKQIFAGGECDDIRIFNNIVYAQKGKPIDFSTAWKSTNIVYANNLYFGDGDNDVKSSGGLGADNGSATGTVGSNVAANPKFVNASLNAATADFRLAPGSAAIDMGKTPYPGVPLDDILGRNRPQGRAPDVGAYEMPAAN